MNLFGIVACKGSNKFVSIKDMFAAAGNIISKIEKEDIKELLENIFSYNYLVFLCRMELKKTSHCECSLNKFKKTYRHYGKL